MSQLSPLDVISMFCLTGKAGCGDREQEHNGWRKEIRIQSVFMWWLLREKEETL